VQLGSDRQASYGAGSAATQSGWRPPARLPDPALLAYVANGLTVLALALALLKLGGKRR
jgi:hypothetical protein